MRPARRAAHPDEAVSSVVGTVLMLGITVAVFTAVGIVVLAYFEAQPAAPRADLGVVGGDGTLLLVHKGGEEVAFGDSYALVNLAGVERTIPLAAIPGAADLGGTWDLGERICVQGAGPTCLYASTQDVRGVRFVVQGFLVVAEGDVGSQDPCPGDLHPPTVAAWQQSPADVAASSAGGVTVRATFTDACYGVDPASQPHLWWRLDDGSGPAYADAGAMVAVSGDTWEGTIPSPGWPAQAGKTLQYYVSGQRDLGSNVQPGVAAVQSDLVDDACPADAAPPTVLSWTQSPTDVLITTTGAVTVTAVLADDCYGVDQAADPTLHYRLDDGTAPAYTSLGAMTRTATSTWQGTIPAQAWGGHSGKTLQYYLAGQRDNAGATQSGVAQVQSDIVQAIPPTYPSAVSPVVGSASGVANLQSAGDADAVAALREGASGSGGTATLAAAATVSAGAWTNPANGFASDNAYATATATGATVEFGLADPPALTGTITAVVLKAEVSVVGFSDDGFLLRACLGATCSAASARLTGASGDVTLAYTVTALRPGGGAWSWADVAALSMQVTADRSGGTDGTWRIDRAWAEVTYLPSQSLEVVVDFGGVPAGTTQTLGLRYLTTGDTFVVQVWDGAGWTTRGAALGAGALTQWTYVLSAAELNGGAPRIRFLDATPTGTVQGVLSLDYVRVVTT